MSTFAEYVRHGWKICSIDRGKKAPIYDEWNTQPIPEDAADGLDGAGLLHALSGTCALDIDNMSAALPWLAERGVDLPALLAAPDAVRIDSGRKGRAKLLYRLSRPLRTLKPKGCGVELRCATADGKSVQDVLPPTIHPDTKKPYQWLYGEPLTGDWSELPPIPASLLALWRQMAAEIPAETVEPQASQTRKEPIEIVRLRKWIKDKDPNCEYDEWLKVGMKLNDATGGAQEGFDLWDEWSSKATRDGRTMPGPVYRGSAVLLTHWHSFSSTAGKTVATLDYELPAEAEEFDIITPEAAQADEDSTEKLIQQTAAEKRKDALAKLEQRLVFVYSDERYFDLDRHKLIGSDTALEHMFTWMMPKTKAGRLSPVKLLKESGTKRYVDAVGFHPGEGVIFKYQGESFANGYRNLLPEPLEPTQDEIRRIHWAFDRIEDADFRDWLMMFYGHVVQHPGVKIKSAPLIWSETQGNGKTTLMRMIPALLVGFRHSREVNAGLLGSDFNDYLLNAWHVNLTEFRGNSRGERESISKKVESWIADDVISVHPKGSRGYTMPNHLFVTGSSNYDDAAAISNNDRKWAIHEMKAPQFSELEQEYLYTDFLLTPRAAGVLRHYFLHMDITNFVASARAPQTSAREEMVQASTSADIELMTAAFEERSELFSRDIVLTHEVMSWLHKRTPAKPSAHRVGRLLCRPPFNGRAIQFRVGDAKYRGVVLRNYEQWNASTGKAIMGHIAGDDVDITA